MRERRQEKSMSTLSRQSDFDRSYDLLDELRRQMDRVWGDMDQRWGYVPRAQTTALSAATFPRVNVFDAGAELVVQADVPGLTNEELEITLHENVLTLSGKRTEKGREGYVVHRQERGGFQFQRSFALPAKVDGEKTLASVKDGVLTVKLAKAAEAKPRQIAVRSQG
jgi:HSP20 family protein